MGKWKNCLMLGMLGVGMSVSLADVSHAGPADTQIGEYKQPSGQEFEAQLVGDEYLNYVLANETGDLIDVGEDGYWYYSLLDENTKTTMPSKSKYLIDKRPAEALSVKNIDKLKQKEVAVNKARLQKNTTKWNKEQNLLVVLVEFNDAQLNYTDADWENRIFSQTSKSLATYYKEATNDQINIVPAKEKYGKQDGIVRVKLDQNHPKAANSFDKVLPSLKDALETIQDLVDLSEYDTNKNGKLEENELHIMSIFAGYEASSINLNPSVWGHHWAFQGQKIGYPVVNGVKVNNYTLFGERMVQKNSDPTKQYEYQSELGLIAHEFGHDLGLPDLYNSEKTIIEQDGKYVSVSDGDGLGKYSVMASGSWTRLDGENNGATPPHLDVYSKVALGIVEPKIVDKTETVAINHISQEGFNVFRLETSNPQEYFLVENRQLVGHDKALATEIYSTEHKYKPIVASGGIAIYHVNEKYRRNISSSEQLVTLKEADEGILGYSKLKQPRYYNTNNYDGFYYKGMGGHGELQQTSLTKTTIPSTAISDGTYPEFDIFVNSESASSMNVTFKGKAVGVTGVSVDPTEVTLNSGKTKQLTAKVMPENADSKTVSWNSSNEEVATVSNTGVVTAKKAGTSVIKVTTEDGRKSATATITVPPIQVVGISLVETDVELNTGQTKQLEAKIVPEDATNKKVTWESSNETVATVSTTGLVTAKNKGAATITATTEDGNKTTTAQINVVEFKSKTIKFVTQKFYLTNEASNNIQAKVFGDKNNWLKEVEVGYESADDSIISVKEEDSKVSVIGKKVGKTTITATALDGSNIKTMFEIEVLPEFGTTKETALELNHEIESDRARVYTTQKGWVKFKAGDRAEYAVDLGVQSETTGVKGTYYNEEGRQIGNSATWVSRVGTGSSKKAYYEKNDYVYMNLEKTKADNTLYNLSISKDKNGQPDLLKKIELNKSKLYMTKGAQQTIKWSVDKTITYTPTTVISVKDNAVGEMDRNEIAGFENLNTQFIAKNVGKTTIVVEATDGFNKVIEEIEVEVLPDFGTTKETALELNHEIESDRARVYTTQKGWVKFKAGDRAAYAVDLGVQSETTGVKGTYYNEEGRQIGNSATWFNRSGTGSSKKAYYEKNDYVYMYLDKTKADDTLYNLSISKDKNGQPDLLKKIELNKSKLYMTKGAQQTIKWSVDKTITYTPTTVISVKDNAVGEVDRNEITGFENLNTQFIAKNVGKTTIVVEATDGFNKVIEEIEVEVLPDFGTTKETALELNSEIELNKNRVLTTQQGWVKVKVSDTAMYEANLSVQSETTGIKGTYYNEAGQQIGNSATWFSRMSSGKSKKAYYEKGDYMYLYLDKTKADDTHYFISIKKNFTNITPN